MEVNFNSAESEPPNLVNSNIGSLLFADDLLVISESLILRCCRTIVFVFLTFTVSCQLSQKSLSLLILFCRPSLLSDITRRSSANNNDPMLELTNLGGSVL
jgi:hypothetical protein